MYYNNRNPIATYGQQQQQGNTGFRPMRQSPALQTPLPEFKPPVGARGQDIMIIWDFQNVRTPTELEPVDVIRFLYNTFVMQPGPRRCAGAFCTFTDNTKKAVGEKRFNQFCSNGVLNFMMINSPGGPRKADDSDHPLKEMMMNFTVDCVRGHKDGVLLLITADADFVRPAIWCKQQGCVSLELLFYGPIASKEIRQLEASWKMEWRDFLDCSVGRRCAWTFPYPQDVAAGLVPPGSSSTGGSGTSSSYGDREHREHRQQQQQPAIAGYLPAPAQHLRLPAPGGAAGSTASGTSAVPPVAVQVSNTHVQQAAQQLLQNPTALHQVVQQYKQSMQTTAVLQQVLQGVAQAAGSNAAGTAPAAAGGGAHSAGMHSNSTGAAFSSAAPRSGFVPVPQQQHSRGGNTSSANGSYSITPSKQTPAVQLFTRPPSASSANSANSLKSPGGVAADSSSSAGGLTWQQLEQQQAGNSSSSSAVRGGSGFWDGPSGMSTSPPPPEWWDSSSSKQDHKPKSGFSSSMPRGSGTGLGLAGAGAAEGLGSRAWAAKTTKYKPDGWAEEEQEEGFWDAPITEQQQQQQQPGLNGANSSSNSRSQTPNKLMSSSSSSNGFHDQQQASTTIIGFGATGAAANSAAAAPVGAGLPPTPSTGLLKRAGSAVGGTGGATGSTGQGSSGALAALLAGAVAKTGGSTSSSPARQHGHHRHTVSGSGNSSALQQLQHQLSAGAEQHRTPSPGLSGGRQQEAAYDRHQQHHELQIAMAQRQQLAREASSSREGAIQDSGSSSHEIDRELRLTLMQQRLQEKEAAAAKNSASATGPEDSGSARKDHAGVQELDRETKLALMQQRLQAKEAAAAAAAREAAAGAGTAAEATSSSSTPRDYPSTSAATATESTGVLCRPRRSSGPGLAAAARLFTRATAEAVAETSHAVAASAGFAVAGEQQRHSGVVVLQAPPVPQWLLPEQQQQLDVNGSSRSEVAALAAAATAAAAIPEDADPVQQQQLEELQQQQQQQQDQEDEYLIDEETGEVIILKPRAVAAAAAAPLASAADSAACEAPEQLLMLDACTADGSSSSGSPLPPASMCTAHLVEELPAAEQTRSIAGSVGSVLPPAPAAAAGDEEEPAVMEEQQQEREQEQLLSLELEVCEHQQQQQQQQNTDCVYKQDIEDMQEQLVHLQLSTSQQQQQNDDSDDLPQAAAAAAHPVTSVGLHQRHLSSSSNTADDLNAAQLAREVEDMHLQPPIDPQVSEAAAIAAAALAATAEELLNELPGADSNLINEAGFCADDAVGFRPDGGFEPQPEPSSSEPEPPSPGPYTPLSPVESGTEQDDGGGQGLGAGCCEGEGLSCGPCSEGPYLADSEQSGDEDFVAKLVRRVSGGMAAPDLNVDLNLSTIGAESATAAAAAVTVACSAPVNVPPVLQDLGIPLGGIEGGLGVAGLGVATGGSGTWLGPLHAAGSPVTAIEELGNVSSSSSSSSGSEHGSANVVDRSEGRRDSGGGSSSSSSGVAADAPEVVMHKVAAAVADSADSAATEGHAAAEAVAGTTGLHE